MEDYLIQVAAGLTTAALIAIASLLGRRRGKIIDRDRAAAQYESSQAVNVAQAGSGNTATVNQQTVIHLNEQIRGASNSSSATSPEGEVERLVLLGFGVALAFLLIVGLLPLLLAAAYILVVVVLAAGSYLYFVARSEAGVNRKSRRGSLFVIMTSVLSGVVALAALPHRGREGAETPVSLAEISQQVGLPDVFSSEGFSVTLQAVFSYFEQAFKLVWAADPGFFVYLIAMLALAVVQLAFSLRVIRDWLAYVKVSSREARGEASSKNSDAASRAKRYLDPPGSSVVFSFVALAIVLGAAFGLWENVYVVVAAWVGR